uniref:Uncharacterized protein n=1 Tax=Lygus hesperus TaxID=30085 RepID=A0A0A9Z510_LYGHE
MTSKSFVASNALACKADSKSKSNISYPECLVCNRGSHSVLSCEKFHAYTVAQSLQYLKNWSGCSNCLSHLHSTLDCKSQWTCRFCKQKHHVMLHRTQLDLSSNPTLSAVLESSSEEVTSVILGTAVVQIKDIRGQFQDVRLVLDCGSQHSFITQRCVRRLGLDVSKFSKRISGIGETAFEGAKGQTACTIRPRDKMSPNISINAVVIRNITSFLPSNPFPQHLIKTFSHFELADPKFWVSSPVDILLGAEVFDQIWTKPAMKFGPDTPSLFPSIFGNVVMGNYTRAHRHTILQRSLRFLSLMTSLIIFVDFGKLRKSFKFLF